MKKLFLMLIVVLVSNQAMACKCVPKSIEEQIKGADSIFSGIVTSYESKNGMIYFTFKVTKTWKGNSSTTNVISTDMSFCGFNFELNTEYVVFALHGATRLCRGNEKISETKITTILNYRLDNEYRNSLGTSIKTELNQNEIYFLNSFSKNFDFKNKRVAFVEDETPSNKKIFFEKWNELTFSQLIIFNGIEKDKSGGYDVVIVTNRKKGITKKFRNQLVRDLKEKGV